MQRRRMDSILSSFVREEDPLEQERLLAELLSVEAQPIIGRVLRQQLGLFFNGSSKGRQGNIAADIHHEIVTRIVERLRRLRSGNANDERRDISDFGSYVSRIAKNVCHDFLREKYPTRHSLKSRIRYLLSAKPEFYIQRSEDFVTWCGLSEWKDRVSEPVQLADEELIERVQERFQLNKNSTNLALAPVLEGLFVENGTEIEVDRLVTLVTQVLGSSETVVESLDTTLKEVHTNLPDQRPRADQTMEDQERLRSLWNEILKLPITQRKLILLSNLDVVGDDLWSLFLESGTVLPSHILEAIGISHKEFMSLWPRVPLSLSDLADHLALTRDQVIRSRFQARDRLKKRLQKKKANKVSRQVSTREKG